MADPLSAAQAFHEEMACLFEIVKQARRFVNDPLPGKNGDRFLRLAIEELDDHRALQRQSKARDE